MLDLLENLSELLDEAYNHQSIVSVVRDFFIKNFKVDRVDIFIYDEKFNVIKDFSNDWFNPDTDISKSDELTLILNKLSGNKIITIKNSIYFNLPKRGGSIGFLKIEGGNKHHLEEFFKIASYIVSLKIQNIILAENMQKNIDFHELIRNIAKIIETQYELNYVVPLIGEMIDKFLANLLTYVFIKENSEYKLMWPSNCKDNNIIAALKSLNDNTETRIIENKKIGMFPLIIENRILGCIVAKAMYSTLTEYDINYLEQLAKQSSVTINRANVYSEILKHATLDALTGFYNRRQLEERIKQETSKAKRQNTPLCAIMTDIDFFKHVNDIHGHAAGDLVLKNVSKTIRSQLREYDIAGRYGGEEFAILLPFTRLEEAVMVAERLRNAVEKNVIDLSKVNPDSPQKTINVTISIGIYEFKSSDTHEDLLKKADKALYKAKETGRNKVITNKDEK